MLSPHVQLREMLQGWICCVRLQIDNALLMLRVDSGV